MADCPRECRDTAGWRLLSRQVSKAEPVPHALPLQPILMGRRASPTIDGDADMGKQARGSSLSPADAGPGTSQYARPASHRGSYPQPPSGGCQVSAAVAKRRLPC